MLALVIEANNNEIIIQDEVGNRHKVLNESEDFVTLMEYHEMESYFEFDPEEKKVIQIEGTLDTEDYSLPEDFY